MSDIGKAGLYESWTEESADTDRPLIGSQSEPAYRLRRDSVPVDGNQDKKLAGRLFTIRCCRLLQRVTKVPRIYCETSEANARRPGAPGVMEMGASLRIAAIHLRNGAEFAVPLDAESEAHLQCCLEGSSDTPRFAWFETTETCLVGLNMAQVNAVFWHHPNTMTPKPTDWDHDELIVHFADRETISIHHISEDRIRRLQEATLSKHRATAFHTVRGQHDDPVSIGLENVTHITMPAVWIPLRT